MSVKGDARSEAPSSVGSLIRGLLSACDRFAGLGFAGFVVLHLACQAMSAHGEGAIPTAGLEVQPTVVAGVLVVIWLPFAVFAWRRLTRGIGATREQPMTDKARALAALEYLTLGIVLLFAALHGAEIAWPLLRGTFDPSDVRPELVRALSSTQHGVPMVAAGYLFGVGAATFFGARQALRPPIDSAPVARPRALGIVALFVLAWLLGCYAVIRCASGVILA